MSGTTLKISIFAIFLIHYSQQFQCPLDQEMKPVDGAYADPNNCGLYYHCVNGTAFLQQCPPGLFFTITLIDCHYQTCVEADKAECSGMKNFDFSSVKVNECDKKQHSFDEPIEYHNELCYEKNENCLGKENGTFPNLNDCRQYYHCYKGLSWPQQCPTGYFFSPSFSVRDCNKKMCVQGHEAKCPINGGWSEWSGWSSCSPSCGDGLSTRTRKCTNPPPSNGGSDCQGNSIDIDLCSNAPCGEFKEPAFMVSQVRPTSVTDNFKWPKINIDYNNMFNATTNRLNIKKSGFYYLSLTASVVKNSNKLFFMQGVGRALGLYSQSTDSPNINARSAMVSLTSLFKPGIIHGGLATVFSTEKGSETSWLGFRYETNNVLFASRSTSTYLVSSFISLYNVLAVRGFSFESEKREFTVSTSGWYFVQFGTGTYKNTTTKISLSVNDVKDYALDRSHDTNMIDDTMTRGVIVYLNKTDKIGLYLEKGAVRSYWDYNSMIAFKLNSTYDSPAFFAYRDTVMEINGESRIAFNNVILDSSGSWDNENNFYRASKKGVYYIDISAGIMPRAQLFIRVKVNNDIRLVMQWLLLSHSSNDIMSRSGLLELNVGDTLTIEALSSVYSDQSRQTAVTIFFVSS